MMYLHGLSEDLSECQLVPLEALRFDCSNRLRDPIDKQRMNQGNTLCQLSLLSKLESTSIITVAAPSSHSCDIPAKTTCNFGSSWKTCKTFRT